MAQTINYDPGSTEARSSWLVGLTEACNKVTGVLDMRTAELVDEPMPELHINDDDRYRIYQVGEGKKLWLTSPAPVIKKNGVVINESTDGFQIDYLGGSIAFDDNKRLLASDTITVTATQIIADSLVVDELKNKTAQYKGAFATVTDLNVEVPTGKGGDYAVVVSDNSFYLWNVTTGSWVTSKSEIKPQGETEDSDWYYYGGRNTWQDLKAKVLGAVLTDLNTSEVEKIQATDTIVEAFGKLQAQINDGALDLQGEGEPTTETVAKIGRDYLDMTTGNKYHLVDIDISGGAQKYIWEQYADMSKIESKYMVAVNPVGTGAFSMNRKEGSNIGFHSHAEGYNTEASALCSHAEGLNTVASGNYSHAEGYGTMATSYGSHAEGYYTEASAGEAHAEGIHTVASGNYSHAEGDRTQTTGTCAHAEGSQTRANALCSHAEGLNTVASGICSHVQGQLNIEDNESIYAHIVGNGNEDDGKFYSNAHTLDWEGNAWYAGDVYVGSTSGTNKDDGSVKLARIDELPKEIADLDGTLPVSQGGTGATTVDEARNNLGAQAQHKTATVTLSGGTTLWNVTVTGVTTNNTIIVCPTDESRENYRASGVICTEQAFNQLTFAATKAPNVDLLVNILILD